MMAVDTTLKLPYHKHLPTFRKCCEPTSENLEKMADKVAKLYGFFLTPEAHDADKSLCRELRTKQMALAVGISPKYFPSERERFQFEEKLKLGILQSLGHVNEHGDLKAKIDMDYHPISPLLEKAIDHLDRNLHAHLLLPSKSRSSIVIEKGQLILDIDLTCPY